jgi:tRNA modification GTPase
LAGPPNAGKSTLFNALAGQSRALVSAEAGTTRDYLAATIEVAGLAVELIDTAGRMESAVGLERQAQELGREQIERADLVIWCRGADQPDTEAIATDLSRLPPNSLRIVTKGDLRSGLHDPEELVVSALSRTGLADLCQAIAARLMQKTGDDSRLLGSTAARSFDSLNLAHAALERAVAIAQYESDQELLAIEVRETLGELGKIAGVVYTDDILDRIFSKFCIGK